MSNWYINSFYKVISSCTVQLNCKVMSAHELHTSDSQTTLKQLVSHLHATLEQLASDLRATLK